jgi:hypothetical protein
MFAFEVDQFQSSPVNVPLRRSRSRHNPYGSYSYRPIRRQRRPKGWVGPLPKPSTLKRLMGKDRMTWHQWLCDWRTSLHKLGFDCQSDLVTSMRSTTTDKGSRRKESLCMVKGDTAIFLYGSIHALPVGPNVDLGVFSTVYHVVQGRRPDASIGVKRLEDRSTAVGIIPNVDLEGRGGFLVEFDGTLFESVNGVWRETMDDVVMGLYRSYRGNSSHFQSIRPYRKAGDGGMTLPNEGFEISDFDDYQPKFTPIKELK